jgi:hypothetical protein
MFVSSTVRGRLVSVARRDAQVATIAAVGGVVDTPRPQPHCMWVLNSMRVVSQAPHRLLAIAQYFHGVPGGLSCVFCGTLAAFSACVRVDLAALGDLPALPPQPCVV